MNARVALVAILFCAACLDKAKPDWDRCVAREKSYDVAGAYSACAAATAADPNSPSGQAATRKLADLQAMLDKMKSEQADKASRDDAIAKEQAQASASTSAQPTASAATIVAASPSAAIIADGADVFKVAKARVLKGDVTGARAMVEPRVMAGIASPDETKLLFAICKTQHDRACMKKYAGALMQH